MTTATATRSTTLPYAVRDSLTMLRRNLRHMQRYPTLSIMLLAQPILFLLMFTYIFGGTLGDGLGGQGGRAEYVGFVTPTILVITVSSAALGTAILVAMDMTEGIIDRFRTMNIFRASVLTGHVIGTFIQTTLALVVVTGVALLVGFESSAGVAAWAGAAGILLLLTIALTWLSVGMGLSARSVESASNSPMIFTLLPFMGSGFVPTDSMPAWLRWFAEYQPFSPVIESVRGLLLGTPIGNSAYLAIGWCVGLTVFGYVWSKRLYGKARKR
jgi:ABC-2 type transport system permease protein